MNNQVCVTKDWDKVKPIHSTSHRIQYKEPFNRCARESVKWRLILPPPSSPVIPPRTANTSTTTSKRTQRDNVDFVVLRFISNSTIAEVPYCQTPLLKCSHRVESNSSKFTSGEEYSNTSYNAGWVGHQTLVLPFNHSRVFPLVHEEYNIERLSRCWLVKFFGELDVADKILVMYQHPFW